MKPPGLPFTYERYEAFWPFTWPMILMNIDEYLTWDNHILSIRQKVTRNLSILKKVKPVLKVENLIDIYRSIIEPYFTYCCIV